MSLPGDDDVVISGIGGKFPEAESVVDLAKKLYAGESLVTKDARKLTKGFYEDLPDCNGKTQSNSVLFDNTFFGISPIVSTAMDPLTCQILQRTFEAVIDAGINPSELRGSNSSVFSGTCHSDSDLEWATDTRSGYGIMGRNRCMNSNRISYWLDLNGTSVSTDSGWTNGLSNLYLGWSAIKSGKCDTAIISTASLQCHALITIQLKDFGVLSPDGISRAFDDSANGFGRSSAVVVLVLQRARCARRNYATIGHVYSACFGDRDGIINKPSQREWEKLFREFYSQAKIDVNDVQYIEAHGSSLREEDAEELNAITEVFCKNRKTPLLVGCVKSNLGHTEASSSFCGIVKSIISLENELIPQNLHYKNPNSLCPGLAKGQIKVVDKNTPISPNGWVAVNSHGYGGTYAHIVLKANQKTKAKVHDGIPRLVLLNDRTNDYMDDLLEKIESVPFDPEYVALLHQIHSRRIEKYLARGYTILPKRENPIHEHQVYGEEVRPVWFIFSGMGSQWPKMGKRLMDLPLFKESIMKSHQLLEKKGLDLLNIITTEDPHIFDNILHSFVGIAAIQVALVDVLRSLNINADGYIGHSVGELGCAYADGCFTAEEMVLAAYYRGRASTETELIKGSMAAVGKGYNSIKDKLPEDIEVACHNSEDSCTLSGPMDSIHKFVDELKSQGIFARSVNVSNIAYHSRYIRPAAPKLLAYLKEVVKNPKPRSSKWISTSNPESEWDSEVAKYCSAEYHTNNLLSSVLFEEGSKHIPKNAICIEIAPHGLLQAILKRSLGENVTNIPLTSRSAEDPLIFLLQAIGKMYMAGINPNVVNLYPKIEFPVSRGTQMLHNLVHWHEQLSATAVTPMEKKTVFSLKNRLVSTADDGAGYIVNEQNVYPLAIFLHLAWDLYSSFHKKPTEECPVVFQNFRLERLLTVHLSEEDNIIITFETGSGNFEIMTDSLLARGCVSLVKEKPLEPDTREIKADLTGDEIYNEFKRKGYDVGSRFKNLLSVSIKGKELIGEISSKSNWVQSIESLIQLFLLNSEHSWDCFLFPKSFERLEIFCVEHKNFKASLGENSNLTITYDAITNTAICGGIKIRGLKAMEVPKLKRSLKFPSTDFFPLMNPPLKDSLRFADFCFSITLDNFRAVKNFTTIKVMEIMSSDQSSSVGRYLQQLFPDYKIMLKTVSNLTPDSKEIMDFIISSAESLEKCQNQLTEGGFVFCKTNLGNNIPNGFDLIGKCRKNADEEFVFLKKKISLPEEFEFVAADGNQRELINAVKELKPSGKFTYVISHKEPLEGIGKFQERIQEETLVKLRWIFILDSKAPKFDSQNTFYKDIIRKGLHTNVYKDGVWGGYCEYNFAESYLQDDVNFALEWTDEITPKYVSFDLNENLLKLQQVEFSGTTAKKGKVMGISRLLNNKKLIQDKYLTWELPDSWNLEDAATVPMSYALAYYCLIVLGNLKKNEIVMVTDGLTCIGRACIAVALTISSRVFVTVNNEEEAVVIKKLFPQVKGKDIINHENVRFDLLWKYEMKKGHADVIVNTLEGERFFSLLNCTGQYGRIFHFGRHDIRNNVQLGSSIFLMSLVLYSKTPEAIMSLSETDKESIHTLMSQGIQTGVIQPLPKIVLTINQLKKLQSRTEFFEARTRTLLDASTIKQNMGYVKFRTDSSYLVIGDETDIWIDVTEWLINRPVENIVVCRRDQTKRSQLRMPHMKKHKNLFVYENGTPLSCYEEAEKLGQLSVIYYINMSSAKVDKSVWDVSERYRNPNSHFVAITKSRGEISKLCKERNELGCPSTNFIWDADEMLINENLEFMGKLCGRESIVHVSPQTTLSTSAKKLVDLLPSTIEDFCDLGSSLSSQVEIVPLPTLSGSNRDSVKEYTPLIFIPGLSKDPVKLLSPVVADFLYPVVCVRIPNKKLSIPQLASFILPELVKSNKGNVFNIVGISWGTHLALELAKQLEEIGAIVGVILIEGPFLNAKALIAKSLESDLLNFIQGCRKTGGNLEIQNELMTEKTWQGQLHKTLTLLSLPEEEEENFCKAAMFVYNNLKVLLDQDTTNINIKGPLNVLVSGEQTFDDKIIWKLSRSILIRYFPVSSEEFLSSKSLWETIHGSAVSQAMSENTVHICSWPALEEFMTQKVKLQLGHDFQAVNVKFSFTM